MSILLPVGGLLLSICLMVLYIKDAFLKKKLYTARLSFGTVSLLYFLLLTFVFEPLIKEQDSLSTIFNYIDIALYVVIIALILYTTLRYTVKKEVYDSFIDCVEKEKLFVYLDTQDRIKGCSKIFASAFGLSLHDLVGTRFFSHFDNVFTLKEMNGQVFSNDDLKRSFRDLRGSKEDKAIKRNVVIQNQRKESFNLNVTDYVITNSNKYKGHVLVCNMYEEESRENEASNDEVSSKLEAMLEITNQALYFVNLNNNTMWINDNLKKLLLLNDNNLSYSDFLNLIEASNKEYYKEKINEAKALKPLYQLSYKLKTGLSYEYIKDNGKYLIESNELFGYIEASSSELYQKTGNTELDSIKYEDSLLRDITSSYTSGRSFELVKFTIANIPQINEAHTRKLGNLVINEYLKAIKRTFVDSNMIYRTNGLDFVFLITDLRKIELLKKALANNNLLNPQITFGETKITLDVYMGVVASSDARSTKELIEFANQALKTAKMEQVRTNYVYFKDLK